MLKSTPSPDEALACESASISSTRFSSVASDAARFMEVVVLPTPPFWLAKAMILLMMLNGLRVRGECMEILCAISALYNRECYRLLGC